MRHPSQRSHMPVNDDCHLVAVFLMTVQRLLPTLARDTMSDGKTPIRIAHVLLNHLFGKTPRERTAKKPPIATTKRANTGGDFRAVSIAPSILCCAAATHATGRRVLLREAPRLPLQTCTMPMGCSCKFRKNADRRDGDRRLFGEIETNRWFAGPESRKHRGRRATAK